MLIPEYAKSGVKPGIVGNACLQYTHNGLDGQFYLGTETCGHDLLIRAFAWRWAYGERWSRKKQNWFDLAFIDKAKIVSVLSLKKQSAVNVYAKLLELESNGILLASMQITLISESVDVTAIDEAGSYEDSYNAVKVKAVEFVSQADCEELQLWKEGNRFDWNIVGEVA